MGDTKRRGKARPGKWERLAYKANAQRRESERRKDAERDDDGRTNRGE